MHFTLKCWLIGKDSVAGSDWGQEEKGMAEDEMAGWHHWLDGHDFEWTPGIGDGEGGLVCSDSWGRKESDMTEQLNWTKLNCPNSETWFYRVIILLNFMITILYFLFLSQTLEWIDHGNARSLQWVSCQLNVLVKRKVLKDLSWEKNLEF